jgi:hypothetical protein
MVPGFILKETFKLSYQLNWCLRFILGSVSPALSLADMTQAHTPKCDYERELARTSPERKRFATLT